MPDLGGETNQQLAERNLILDALEPERLGMQRTREVIAALDTILARLNEAERLLAVRERDLDAAGAVIRKWSKNKALVVAERDRLKDAQIKPPYCQVIGRNAIVLLTPEQIQWVIDIAGKYPVTAEIAAGVSGEMHRAQNAIRAVLSAGGDE